MRWFIPCLLSLAMFSACGGPQPALTESPGHAQRLLLLQIDGLDATTLQSYLGAVTSRGEDRVLHRVLGATAPGGGRIDYLRARGTSLLLELPTRGAATAVTTFTGRTATAHGVRTPQDTLATTTPTLFEQLPAAMDLLTAGFDHHRGAHQVGGDDDRTRIAALRANLMPRTALVTLRLTGLAQEVIAKGPAAAVPALADLDRALTPLLLDLGPQTTVLLMGGHGFRPISGPNGQKAAAFAKFLALPESTLELHGGLLRIHGATLPPERAAQLSELTFTEAVLFRAEAGVLIFDNTMKSLRPLEANDLPHPDLAARLKRFADVGDWIVLANRPAGFEFQVGDRVGAGVGFGGVGERASRVPLLLAGPAVHGVPLDALSTLRHVDIAATVTGLLGADPRRLGGLNLATQLRATPEVLAKGRTRSGALVIETPFIGALQGPAFFEAPATQHAAYTTFAAGVAAFRAGRFVESHLTLSQVTGLGPDAEMWRRLFADWAARLRPDMDPDRPAPTLTGWPAAIRGALPFITSANGLSTSSPTFGGEGVALLNAAAAFNTDDTPWCQREPRAAQLKRLERSAQTFARLGLPGFAAKVETMRLGLSNTPATRVARLKAFLHHVSQPEAAWSRPSLGAMVLMAQTFTASNDPQVNTLLSRVARMTLLDLQHAVHSDRFEGYKDRNVSRLAVLSTGIGNRLPALTQETLALGLSAQPKLSTALIRALVSGGGFAALLSPDLAGRLKNMLGVMQAVMAPLEGRPLASLSGDERVARALTAMIAGVVATMEMDLSTADTALKAADAALDHDALFTDRDAALKLAGEDETPTLAAWGPFVRVAIYALRATYEGAVVGQPAQAEATLHALVRFAQRFAEHTLKTEGHEAALAEHVTRLIALLDVGLTLAFNPENADGRAAAFTAATALRLDLPTDADAETPGRWLVLTAMLARDALWALEAVTPEAKPDPAQLKPVTEALQTLVATWHPKSSFGRAALVLLLAGQRALPDLPKILAGTTMDRLTGLAHLTSALDDLQATARADLSDEARLRRMVAEDRVDLLLLDHLLTLLDAGLPVLSDKTALVAVLEGRNRVLLSAVGAGEGSDLRALLAMEQMWLLGSTGALEEVLAWAKKGRTYSQGTVFQDVVFLWDVLSARYLLDAQGEHPNAATRALAALDRAAAACPPAAWQINTARSLVQARQGDLPGAFERLRHAINTARQQGTGPLSVSLQLDAQDGNTLVNTTVEVSLISAILGKFSGSFNLGAGATSDADGHHNLTWALNVKGTPREVAFEAWILGAWAALEAEDEPRVQQSLADVDALMMGVDPRWLGTTPEMPAPWQPPAAPTVRIPLELEWVAALAWLRGHRQLAQPLLGVVPFVSSPYGERAACAEPDAPDDDPRCLAPMVFTRHLSVRATRAVAAVVEGVRKIARDEALDERAWRKTLKTAAKVAPHLVPRWVVELERARLRTRTPKRAPAGPAAMARLFQLDFAKAEVDEATVLAAVSGGYGCEVSMLYMSANTPPREKLAKWSQPCAYLPVHLKWLVRAADAAGAEGLDQSLRAITLALRMPEVNTAALDQLWRLARRQVITANTSERVAAAALKVAEHASTLEQNVTALHFRALHIAASLSPPAAADALLKQSQQMTPETSTFLRRYRSATDDASRAIVVKGFLK